MASRRAEFLAAHDRIQNGREAMASRRAEFIAVRDITTMWEEFEDVKAEWAVEQEAVKAAQRERKSQKALKKREACCRKKEKDARAAAERSAEIQAKEEEGLGKEVDPYPLIYRWTKTMRPHRPGKTRLSPKRHHQWHGWEISEVY